LGAARRGSLPGNGTSGPGIAAVGAASRDGAFSAGGVIATAGGGEAGGVTTGGRTVLRSSASSRRVSRSIARNASHEDSDPTSTVRCSPSDGPTANTSTAGRPVACSPDSELRLTRMSV
jgi:hypothetical protein